MIMIKFWKEIIVPVIVNRGKNLERLLMELIKESEEVCEMSQDNMFLFPANQTTSLDCTLFFSHIFWKLPPTNRL